MILFQFYFDGEFSDPAVAALRRQQLFGKRGSQMSDDEPLYDSVASDDDYGTLSNDKKNQYNKTSPNEVI